MTKRKGLLIISFILLCTLLLGVIPTHAAQVKEEIWEESEVSRARTGRINTYSLDTVSSRSPYAYPSRRVTLGGKDLGNIARVINGESYLQIRHFVENYVSGARVSYSSATRTITVSGGGHSVSVSDGAYALYANGRVFFSKTPSVILGDGRMYVPVSNLAKAFSLSYRLSADGALNLLGTPTPPVSGSRYYDADAVYWLSRIISAESRGEPLIGQIAVGAVVLNRVRSSAFPNTIWGVIFDRKWGVQFSPVANGTIYNEPTSTAILAAKICLDGFTPSPDALYFLRPSASASSWIINSRPFLWVIGNHYFFA